MPVPLVTEVTASTQHPLGLPQEVFLRDYWQQHPLLIRQAFPDFTSPLSADDLGGLSLEEMVSSLLIEHQPDDDQWRIHTGPIDEALYAALPDQNWMLQVQDVDKWDDDVAALIPWFNFLPSWRLSGITVSYAEQGGTDGPHLDWHDAFLLSGTGGQRIGVDSRKNVSRPWRENVPLKVLNEFVAQHQWDMASGDLLYLPAGMPCHIESTTHTMLFSINWMAPSKGDLLVDLAENLAEQWGEQVRYSDTGMTAVKHTGEIDDAAVRQLMIALGPVSDLLPKQQLANWFAAFITRYQCAHFAAEPPHSQDTGQIIRAIQQGTEWFAHPWTRMAWVMDASTDAVTLFAAGKKMGRCSSPLAEKLCSRRPFTLDKANISADIQLLQTLLNAGHIVMEAS